MSARRKICVVTGTRAELGLLTPLLERIADHAALELQIVATGMHLSPEFGLTYHQIEAAGFAIDAKVEMLLSSDTPLGVTKSIGLGVIGFADALERLRPDILVVLGDRFEILAAAQAALILRIPIAHIHGGETTEGAFDESIRHALTKMARWHFVAAEPYRKRVVQMGENPAQVYDYGAPGLDQLASLAWLTRPELEAELDMRLGSPLFLVTYHPVTLGDEDPARAMAELTGALAQFPDATIVFSYPNADTGGRQIIAQVEEFIARHRGTARAFVSLGHRRYLSLMREADVIIGNSSSGLTEAPVLKKATVNIGDRQKGRLAAASVIHAAESQPAIVQAICAALSAEFQASLPGTASIYGYGDASRRIAAELARVPLEVRKVFFDIEHGH